MYFVTGKPTVTVVAACRRNPRALVFDTPQLFSPALPPQELLVNHRNRALFRLAILAAFSTASLAARSQSAAVPAERPDNYTWLEDVNGARAMDWVKAEDARTAKIFEADPRYGDFQAKALKIFESADRLAEPEFRGEMIFNTWQDAEHVRGILRKTTLADYLTPQPHWTTVIDYDALAKADNEKWVQKGLNSIFPYDGLSLVNLSAGGEDAVTVREFDLKTGKFVEGGFVLPKSKQRIAWEDKDTLLVARDWGNGTMTPSGYPYIVKRWKRGTPLDQAIEVFRGGASDGGYGVTPFALNDAQGHQALLIGRPISTFELEVSLVTAGGVRLLGLPRKVSPAGLLDGQLIFTINEDWTPTGGDKKFAQGSVLSFDLKAAEKDPIHIKPQVVFAPTAQEFEHSVATTRNYLLLATLEHVQGRAYACRFKNGEWTRTRLNVPENQSVAIEAASSDNDKFFLGLTGFLTPSSYHLGDASTGELKLVKTLPAQFDASQDVVEQLEATSKDGTKVPYFVVHRKDMRYDGSNPTLIDAYGGFQISMTPSYSGVMGKLWLEPGAVFVMANIRGGGEFGPAWHEAGLKTHRQRIYDDFAAVGQDLIARKITSPRRLGILGGSNGGLLMGVEFNQHPDMWNAVVIQVPLLDMLGFEHIAAGASWVGEYGSVTVPEERKFLASISPYNNLDPARHYPEPLIFTTTKDDRVGPVHARKFAARMEEFHLPFYYDEIVEGGHAAGADLKEAARTYAETYLYLTRKLVD
jgi:prolyl oligopeptidase